MDDAQFLRFMLPDANDAEIQRFCERVAVMVVDGPVDEDTAREAAYHEIIEARA